MAVSDQEIRDYIDYVLSLDMSDAEKSATINAAAEAAGVSNERIADATGYAPEVVNAFLGAPEPEPAPELAPSAAPVFESPTYYEPEPAPVYTATDGSTFASASERDAYQQEMVDFAAAQRAALDRLVAASQNVQRKELQQKQELRQI